MKTTPHTTAGLAVEPYTSPVQMDRIASPNGRPVRNLPLMRKYQVAHLTPSGQIIERSLIAAAIPAIENAFACFGHGTLLTTETGMVAIEDLLPGDKVLTKDYGFQPVLWHGSFTLPPNTDDDKTPHLTRLSAGADTFGATGPVTILGPAARLRIKTPLAKPLTGAEEVFVPASDRIDGHQLIPLRQVSPMQVYQIGFACHTSVQVNGKDIETLHPGPIPELRMRGAALDSFLTLFGHMQSLTDFGPMIAPRIRQEDLDLVAA